MTCIKYCSFIAVVAEQIQELTPTTSLTSPGSLKWVTSQPKQILRPLNSEPAYVSHAPFQDVDSRSLQPIRVDNWGIFLLSRLQAYFQKKEHCDLTIRSIFHTFMKN